MSGKKFKIFRKRGIINMQKSAFKMQDSRDLFYSFKFNLE